MLTQLVRLCHRSLGGFARHRGNPKDLRPCTGTRRGLAPALVPRHICAG
jgi:hypothetical protein